MQARKAGTLEHQRVACFTSPSFYESNDPAGFEVWPILVTTCCCRRAASWQQGAVCQVVYSCSEPLGGSQFYCVVGIKEVSLLYVPPIPRRHCGLLISTGSIQLLLFSSMLAVGHLEVTQTRHRHKTQGVGRPQHCGLSTSLCLQVRAPSRCSRTTTN